MKKQIKDVISAEFKGLWGTDFSDNGIPVIKTNNMTYEGRIDYSDICIRNITSEEAKGNFLCNGDLIIEKSGGTKTHSVGYVNIFEGEDNKYVCNNFILSLRPNRDLVNPKYLFWQLHGMYEAGRFSDCFNKTTGIQNLQKKTYYSKKIKVPPLPEQQKIAHHLDTIQSAIDNKKQQLVQLDELVKSRFVEMFGETPVESGKWKVEKLKELTSKIGSGSTPKGGKGSYVEEGVSLIRSMNVHNGYFDYEDLAHLTDAQAKSLDGVKIEEGDVLINITGASVARCCIVPSDVLPARVNQHVSILRIKRDLMSVFLNYFLISDEEQFALLDIGGGGGATREAITKTELENLVVPVPPIDLQNTFAEYVQKINSTKSIIKTQLADLQELLDSKMNEYFGE